MREYKGILNELNAIRREDWQTGTRYFFKCLVCPKEIISTYSALGTHSGKCRSCSQKKRPFESIYTAVTNSDNFAIKNSTLTYEEFLEFTKVKNCHYCNSEIGWSEYRGNDDYKRYYLDRKNSNIGYHVDNLVTCCTSCNYLKSNKFTYEEFMMLAPGLKRIAKRRNRAKS